MTPAEQHLRAKLIQMIADPSQNCANIVGGAMMLMCLCGSEEERQFAQQMNEFVATQVTGTLQ